MTSRFRERLGGMARRLPKLARLAGYQPPLAVGTSVSERLASVAGVSPDHLSLFEALIRGLDPALSEFEKYRIAEALAGAVYPKYKFSEYGRIFLEDGEFLAAYERFMDLGNWHSLDRKYTLVQLLRLTLNLEGDVAECGVYRGGSAWLICRAIRPYGKLNHLFDSFEGLSPPVAVDGDYWSAGGLRMDEAVVRENLREFDNVVFHRGWIPERFSAVREKRFSFVHIDVDLYEPTRDSTAFFYPRLSPGAVMLFDDYGFVTCPGAKRAVDEFFDDKPERVIMLPTGQAFAIRKA